MAQIRNIRRVVTGSNQIDGAGVRLVRVIGRGDVEDFDVEFCSNGLCLSCCDDSGECHLECVTCKRRVEAFELCECCGRCDLHDCRQDEDLDRWADAKGDEMRDERAIGGAL